MAGVEELRLRHARGDMPVMRMKDWRGRAADMSQKRGGDAAKMRFASRPGTTGFRGVCPKSFEMEHVRMMPFVLPDCPVPNTFSRWIWLEGCDFVHSIGLKAAILCNFIIIRL